MIQETLLTKGKVLVRRMRLEPGQAMPWHRDPCNRISIVLQGDQLAIETRDNGLIKSFAVRPGQVDWDEPTNRIHRGVNVGELPYEEIVIFFLEHEGDIPQPDE